MLAATLPNQRRPTSIANLHIFQTDRLGSEYSGETVKCGISLVLQGETLMSIGQRDYTRKPGKIIAFAVDLPVSARITQASPSQPFLSAELRFDPKILSAVMAELPAARARPHPQGVMFIDMDEGLHQAFVRLFSLLEHPSPPPYLCSLLQHEICFRLLTSPQGHALHEAIALERHSQHIARATRWLQENFDQNFKVEDLAAQCNMSASSFYQHFRSITTMSPVQYQKQLRLMEAQLLIRLGHKSISAVAYRVGYASVSQFSKDYTRHFGINPSADGPASAAAGDAPS